MVEAFIFGPGLFLIPLLWMMIAVSIAVPIWAIVDAASHSNAAFHAAGSSKATWIVVLVAFTILFDVVGLFLAIFYLAVTRQRVRRFDA